MTHDFDYDIGKMHYDALLQAAEADRLYKSMPRLHPNRWELLIHGLGNSLIQLGQWLQGWKGAEVRPLSSNPER